MKELKRTAFEPRTVLIASRDHLCVNSSVNHLKGTALNAGCRAANKGVNPCVYKSNIEKAVNEATWDPQDIEELHKLA